MKWTFLKKKKTIFLIGVVFILVLIAGWIFWEWWEWRKEEIGRKVSENTYVELSEYEIIDTPEGKIVECKNEGFRVVGPREWRAEKDDSLTPSVGFVSPEFDYKNVMDSIREKGACVFVIEIYRNKIIDPEIPTFADGWRYNIAAIEANPEKYKKEDHWDEVVLVGGKKALKWTSIREGEIRQITITVPANQTVYTFWSGLIISQKCVEEFNKIIDTISINK